MVELRHNESVDYFDGISILDALLNPPKPTERFIPPLEPINSKPPDATDIKLVGYLMGKKVYFDDEELEKYIIE